MCALLLLVIAYQDFKYRAVWWFLFPALAVAFLFPGLPAHFPLPIEEIAFNLGFIFSQLILLWFYVSIKQRSFVNIVNTHIGMGDILFLVAICFAFSIVNLLFFYITGLLLVLSSVIMVKFITGKEVKHVPLAGGLAVVLAGWLIAKNILFLDFFKDPLLNNFLR